ncbi:HAD-IIB family hydrolase [Phragmitibacter flavus]|uniref:HAD-IIB family hydrolase n=1 Tax=Phragmitibacter flavus TaxID=2576071 RepID=A0A5R8KGR4_9BACT|nr:HAD-IIB family hydrolase [Phragmitibacter flavus]TLD71437.1 HAD-IIB family hydrolase [Phragmitibacter flavus]
MAILNQIRVFSSDLDGTLVGKPDSSADFTCTWKGLGESRPLLVYNTGRLLSDARRTVKEAQLPEPDYYITGVGTVIYEVKAKMVLHEFSSILSEEWDRDRVEEIVSGFGKLKLEKQPEHFQHDWKSSWFWRDATPEDLEGLTEALREEGLSVQVVYSSARDLDVLPKPANKGNSLRWLCRKLGVKPAELLVAGDTGNDISMFQLPGVRGIVVENAEPELLGAVLNTDAYVAKGSCAAGVLAGLLHFEVIDAVVACDVPLEGQAHDPEIVRLFDVAADTQGDETAFLKLAYSKALESLDRCVTPVGFSACSIGDNDVTGTDENYNSVWGRDGSMAIVGSLAVPGDRYRDCQRATLRTLLTHLAPSGQVPANVHIRTGIPDYSGVGGIAAIDSGMWAIIALFEFVAKTDEMKFLREFREAASRIMLWLEAHDSNQDGLLEIPEAGDWMDLFNRSYNVLYDEVLWYRATIAYGRIHELLGDRDTASTYLLRAERVKRAILKRFWPSTSAPVAESGASFAEVQRAIGDSRYLLAQVTPFSFDWRCDVIANVMAFLNNVIDVKRAKTVFRYVWGVGANMPYPVRNLYPVVHAGDPDWRSYYTVNLLNLPHHYHNGGIWGWCGGHWVRFIHRLGLRDIARQELVKLAELNRQGVTFEWEFNEWCHGETGRPMGKAFQAWSASEFLAAYHEVMDD